MYGHTGTESDWARCTILGTAGPDVLTDAPGPDMTCHFYGADVIDGRGGDGIILGGQGGGIRQEK